MTDKRQTTGWRFTIDVSSSAMEQDPKLARAVNAAQPGYFGRAMTAIFEHGSTNAGIDVTRKSQSG